MSRESEGEEEARTEETLRGIRCPNTVLCPYANITSVTGLCLLAPSLARSGLAAVTTAVQRWSPRANFHGHAELFVWLVVATDC